MHDPISKVVPGQPVNLSATCWNRFVDAANAELRLRGAPSFSPYANGIGPATILVQNATNGALPIFSVLSLRGQAPLIAPSGNLQEFQNDVMLAGITPTGAGQPLAILLEPLGPGVIGEAVVSGAVQVQINVTSAGHSYATSINGDSAKLVSQADAAAANVVPILWKESGTGVKWAVVMLPVLLGRSAGFSGAHLNDKNNGASSPQSAGPGGSFAVSFPGVDLPVIWDTDGYYNSASPTLLTAPVGGYYEAGFLLLLDFAGMVSGDFVRVSIGPVGASPWFVSQDFFYPTGVTPARVSGEGSGYLNAGSSIELIVENHGGGLVVSTLTSSDSPVFWINAIH